MMARAQSVFKLMEAMSIMRGAFNEVPDFCARTKRFLISEMGGADTPENRKAFIKKCNEGAGQVLHLSEQLVKEKQEFVDPVLEAKDMCDTVVQATVRLILDFRPENDNEAFVEALRTNSTMLVQNIVADLLECFNDLDGVFKFIEENVKAIIGTFCEDKQKQMAQMIATPGIMKFFKSAWEQKQKEDEGDAPMEELPPNATPEQRRDHLLKRYQATATKD